MTIDDWRGRIDSLEDNLIALLNQRAAYAQEIGKIKRKEGLPFLDPAREQAILDRVAQKNKGPLSDAALQAIFRALVSETRKMEETENAGG
jgi:chorismate mutase-like protein